MKLADIVADMRASGVRRVEIELFEPAPATEPAPPLEPESPEEDKPPGSCIAPGCIAKAGFHFAPAFCEKHGLAELGVRA